MTGPTWPITRVFWRAVSDAEVATSNSASTRVSVRWACWPPGPLEREKRSSISRSGIRTLRVTRTASPFLVDSPCMAAILLDIDGVFHVSGAPIAGAADAVGRLREAGHRLRFLTNTTIRTRVALHAELASFGIELDEAEIQTTAAAAVHALRGRRVLALTMPSVVADLEGLELVGEDADAVLVGGADEGDEAGRVFSYMNLTRAFAELRSGADLVCLHKNRWWQTVRGPLLDSGAFVAGLEYAAGVEALVLGKPSPQYFSAALEALDAEPALTWMVGDDIEADIAGAQKFGLRTALVRTGKFRPDDLERSRVVPDIVINSVAEFPEWLERTLQP
jgi:HAD superfamily hydrolase (TIGR01458 family)